MIFSVESIAHLKELANVEGYGEFFISQRCGIRSLKRVRYLPNEDLFMVHHEIDDTWDDYITEEELHILTNIPNAIANRVFFLTGYDN